MPAYKNANGTWYVSFYYRDMNGKNMKKKKTGFATKREALAWERHFIDTKSGTLNIPFAAFVEIYKDDIKPRLRYNTWVTKEHVIDQKMTPFFGSKIMSEITAADVIKWQNYMINYRNEQGEGYSETYLRTIHNQLSSVFNHAMRYYNLRSNPVRQAGGMGREKSKEMEIWTREEYQRFANAVKENKDAFYAFEILYWCGLRIGELLALTGKDFDFENHTLTINKSYQRLNRKDYITEPKTEKSNRVISLPSDLSESLQRYLKRKRRIRSGKRIFTMSKNYLHTVMTRYAEIAGVKRIRIHDLRHSHVSLLISLGFTPVDIASRLGHESINITLHYAHMFPSRQIEMAQKLNLEINRKD